ncbi:hypothetical protein nACB2_074 [Acinetobacter phage nACB2]|nr:hypothetical protein nACB2_074 [Acinetobacter phage nACB2]
MRTVEIFEYRGCVGAKSDIENGHFLNNPSGTGQMGIVISSDHVFISPSALAALKKSVKKLGGSFANTMLTTSADGRKSLGLMGKYTHGLKMTPNANFEIGRTCDVSVLDSFRVVEDIKVPEDFKEHIDEELGPEVQEVKEVIEPIASQEQTARNTDMPELDEVINFISDANQRISDIQARNEMLRVEIDRNNNELFSISNYLHLIQGKLIFLQTK